MVNFWRLTPEAIQSGCIQSTTRYRKLQSQRRALNSGRALQRQPSMSRGSHTRVVKPRPTHSLHGENMEPYHQPQMAGANPIIGHHYVPSGLPSMQYMQRPTGAIVGCTTMLPPSDPVFLDTADQGPTFTMGNGHGWYATDASLNRVHDPSELHDRSASWQTQNEN